MIIRITIRGAGSLAGFGDTMVRVRCRSWHINERTGALMIHGEDNGAAMAYNRGYWLVVTQEGLNAVEILPPEKPQPYYPRETGPE